MQGALDARQIPAGPEKISATVEGEVESRNKVPVISRIRVHYDLKVPRGQRDATERPVAIHEQSCQAAQSVKGAIPVEITADITEE